MYRAAVLDPLAAQVEPFAGELDDDREDVVVEPFELLTVELVNGQDRTNT